MAVSIAADNERFSTDVGVRNTRGNGALIASGGREGYLQMGPNIPLKAGEFKVRWIGTTEAGVGEPLGMVEAWTDGTRMIARRAVFHGEFPDSDKTLAELTFMLDEPTTDIEYRLFVQKGVKLVLERINLESTRLMGEHTQ